MAGSGTNRTIIDAITPSTILSPGLAGGVVRCMVDTYTGTAAEAGATLTVKVGGTLPTGAHVLGVTFQANANGITVDVGDAEDTDRYISAAAEKTVSYCDNVLGAIPYEVDMTTASTPDNQILLTLSGACAAAQQGIVIFYTID